MRMFILSFISLVFVASASAAPITITPSADQTIGDANLDGTPDGLLTIGDGYLRTGFAASLWRSAIEFDLSAIGGPATINSANLLLADRGSSGTGVLNIWGYVGDGVISLADGSETSTLVNTINIVSSAGAQDFVIDVAAFLQSAVDSAASYAGFLIGANTSNGLNGGSSDMCASADGSYGFCAGLGPRLVVDFSEAAVPAPGALVLLGFGLIGLGMRRRTA